jgi:hypothetical protein
MFDNARTFLLELRKPNVYPKCYILELLKLTSRALRRSYVYAHQGPLGYADGATGWLVSGPIWAIWPALVGWLPMDRAHAAWARNGSICASVDWHAERFTWS